MNLISKLTNNMPLYISILFALLSLNSFGQTRSESLQKFIDDPELKNASISFEMIELATGKTTANYNKNRSLMTASIMKAVTTSTALELFGAEHRFETKIFISGEIKEGVLIGNIIVRGEGDPTIESPLFEDRLGTFYQEILETIQINGIEKVQGKVIGDGSYFKGATLPGSTAVGDVGNYYGAGAHALSIYDNSYEITLSSKDKNKGKTKVEKTVPVINYLTLNNYLLASNINKDLAYIHSIPNSPVQSIFGTIPKGKSEFTIKGAIPQPEKLVATELTMVLENAGISVSEKPISSSEYDNYSLEKIGKTQLLTRLYSPTLEEIVKITNYKSLNSYANILLMHIAKSNAVDHSFDTGCEYIKKVWTDKGVNTVGWYQEDGSGLSRANALNASQIAHVLYNTSPENQIILKQGFKKLNKDPKILVKSGYMSRVRSYAGFLYDNKGKEYAFAIIVNNHDCSASAMRKKIEVLMTSYK